MSTTSWSKLNQIFPKVLNHYNLAQLASAAQVMRHFQEVVEELISKDVAHEAKAISLSDRKILTITTTHNAVAQEIQLRKPEILQKLNSAHEATVKDLRFKMQRENSKLEDRNSKQSRSSKFEI